ncbi:MAG: UDP-N-acetylmuramoyl-L-alanyl-D-glutamate--2,6-diaminopimelate ligase [Intestinibaculum porci]|uniref:UDP-N-acetylmuramoyl-L-alanyl-D-glutamate--2, 6-diaminopimelate ligase n=1 Tax=Intestinibaculum porci TaxID=2487118 RepID=UPI003F02AFE1
MYNVKELLKGVSYSVEQGSDDITVADVVYDSRKVTENTLFVCVVGANFDSHDAAQEVISKGAKVLVVEHDIDYDHQADVTIIRVDDTRYAMAFIAASYYGHPADALKVIGITGTKGKTTTSYMVKSILEHAGYKVGLIGTVETIIGDKHIPSVNTTPESYVLQRRFQEMVDAGIEVVVMEVSSQALKLHRTQGFTFELGILTNISPDHIGPHEHASFEEYMQCKGLLFKQCKKGIVNCDDEHYKTVIEGHTCSIETYGLHEKASLRAKNLQLVTKPGELGIAFDTEGIMQMHIEIPTPGKFSVYNALTAMAICHHFNVHPDDMQEALLHAKAKGRIEMVKVSDDFTLMIDYAHNAMALESLLSTLKEYHPHRLVVLFGCGGNRSKLRRYEMGEVAGKLADFTIITSDNPRFEEPLDIIHDIETGMKKTTGKYIEIPDRREAIAYAIDHGEKGDIIVLAGKGHEDYQDIKGHKYPMDERQIIADYLASKKEAK